MTEVDTVPPPGAPMGTVAGAIAGPGWSGPVRRPSVLARLRRFAIRHAFMLSVVLPTALVGVYLFAYAAPQYVSEARFLIRGRQGGGGGGLSEALASAGFRSASEDAMGVRDYLQSHDVVTALRGRLPLVDLYRRPEADLLARLWWPDPSAERLLDYFKDMVAAEFDTTSGITTLRARAFRAEDAQQVTETLLRLSEELVNRLNRRLQDDGLRVAREELTRAEARITDAQAEITAFRERERAVDPTRSAAIAVDTVGRLEGALAQARAELAEAQRFARADNPRVVSLRNRIEALNAQAAEERARMTSADTGMSGQIGTYERLNLARELARGQLASATASMERARVDTQRQQIFLLRIVEPNLAERARYPKPFQTVLYTFITLAVLYGLAWLLIAGTREHAS